MKTILKECELKEILIRFCLGGTTVVLCYLISTHSPAKLIGGIFVSFPAIIITTVIMTGLRFGNSEAANVSRGTIAGLVGCTVSIIATIYLIKIWHSLMIGLSGAVAAWLIVSIITNNYVSKNTLHKPHSHS